MLYSSCAKARIRVRIPAQVPRLHVGCCTHMNTWEVEYTPLHTYRIGSTHRLMGWKQKIASVLKYEAWFIHTAGGQRGPLFCSRECSVLTVRGGRFYQTESACTRGNFSRWPFIIITAVSRPRDGLTDWLCPQKQRLQAINLSSPLHHPRDSILSDGSTIHACRRTRRCAL